MSELTQNPKHVRAQKEGKLRLEYLPVSQWENDAHVHQHGGEKYGLRNWRIDSILASTYVGAMLRHLKAWIEGDDIDPDSGKPHLTHLRACCAVVLDGQAYGKLIDDRLLCESKDPTDGSVKSAHVPKPSARLGGSIEELLLQAGIPPEQITKLMHPPVLVHPSVTVEPSQLIPNWRQTLRVGPTNETLTARDKLPDQGYPSPRCGRCHEQPCRCIVHG